MADRWRRTFVVSHLNRDFSSGYMDCAILTWRMCLCVAECCGSSDRSASWFCARRHLRKICKRTLLCFILLAKRLTQAIVVILRLLLVLCGPRRLSVFTTGARTSYISSYLFIPLHTLSYSVVWSPWYNRTGWLGVKHQLTYSVVWRTTCLCLCDSGVLNYTTRALLISDLRPTNKQYSAQCPVPCAVSPAEVVWGQTDVERVT